MSEVKLQGVPILRIGDVAAARSFYRDALGFRVDWEDYYEEGAPVYMQVSRSGLVLHLSENERYRPGTILYVGTEGIEQLRAELSASSGGWSPPEVAVTPWGTKQMEVEDPFGNQLRFNEQPS